MTLEEAQNKIKELEGEIADLGDSHKSELDKLGTDHAEALKKETQISYNKGFDKAKNASKEDIEKGYVSKDEVQKMMDANTREADIKLELTKSGVKNVDKAFKLIENKEDFKIDDFKKDNDFLFPSEKGDGKDDQQPPKDKQQMRNNKDDKVELNAETYAQMSDEEREEIPIEDKFNLL